MQRYKDRLQSAEHIVFIFPIWWELMPARMKGFVDKVIFPGIAYDYADEGGTGMVSLLKRLKGVSVITTMNTPWYLYWLIFGNAIQRALMRGTFWKIGVKNRTWISLNNVKGKSKAKREAWLAKIEARMRGPQTQASQPLARNPGAGDGAVDRPALAAGGLEGGQTPATSATK